MFPPRRGLSRRAMGSLHRWKELMDSLTQRFIWSRCCAPDGIVGLPLTLSRKLLDQSPMTREIKDGPKMPLQFLSV